MSFEFLFVRISAQVANGTLRYDQTQSTEVPTKTLNYLMPDHMKFHVNPPTSTPEGKPFASAPQLRVYASDNQWVQNLGTESDPWIVEATLSGGSDTKAKLVGKTRVSSINGTFNFADLSISHIGSGYTITYTIVHPTDAAPTPVTSGPHTVVVRPVAYSVDFAVGTVYQYAPVRHEPKLTVRDQGDNAVVNTGWADRKWLLKAELVHNGQPSLSIHGTLIVELDNGVGEMSDVSVTESGTGFQLKFSLYTEPASSFTYETTSATFEVQPRQLTNLTSSQSK